MATEYLEIPSPLFEIPFEEEIMPPAKEKVNWQGWLALVLTFVIAVGGATAWIAREFSDLDKHISRVETAVRIIGAKQGGDTQTLIDETLKVAFNDAKAGRTDGARTVLAIANRLIANGIETRTPVSQETIQAVFSKYKNLEQLPALKNDAHDGMLKLADYHSATVTAPPNLKGAYIGESGRIGPFRYFKNSVFVGPMALGTGPEGTVIDNLILENVTFVNTVIIYRGGAVILNNVKFVNCSFRVPASNRGDQLLEAAIQENATAKIG